MIKRTLGIWLVICILGTIVVPVAYGASEIQISSKRNPTVFHVENYSAASNPDKISTAYSSFNPGQWLEYKINIKEAGKYYIGMYVAFSGGNATLKVTIDGVDVCSTVVMPNGSFTDYSMMRKLAEYEFTTGVHTLRITHSGAGMHLKTVEIGGVTENANRFDFSRKEGAYKENQLPTIIYSEDYDIGEDGSLSNDKENSGRQYRPLDDMDVFLKSGTDGDYYTRINMFEYAKYSFTTLGTAVYTMSLKTMGVGKLSVYIDDLPYPISFAVSSRDYEKTKDVNILFGEGEHRIKIACEKNLVNLDEIEFVTAKDATEYYDVEDLSTAPVEIISDKILTDEPDYDLLDKRNNVYKSIYVSENGNDENDGSKGNPFKTIKRAVDEVATLNEDMTGDIVVNFASGTYYLDEKINLSENHSGNNGYNVIFQGPSEGEDAVFSGGQRIKGWEKYNDLFWKTTVSGVDEVRNLYVNDYPAVRASSKYRYTLKELYTIEGSNYASDGFIVDGRNFPKIENPGNMETYWPIWWGLGMHPVEDIEYRDDGKIVLKMEQPSWSTPYRNSRELSPGKTFYLVNAMELMDEPGEFYFDREAKEIYYYPYNEEDMTTAETYVGKSEQLFDIKGVTKENKIKNIVFDNITFKHGKWDEASRIGYAPIQSDRTIDILTGEYGTDSTGRGIHKPAGQVEINNAENITITNCEFSCLGSTALRFNDSVTNVKIEGNIIRDVAGGAIAIGANHHTTEDGVLYKIGVEPCENFMIRNNVITRNSFEYQNNCGIAVYFEGNVNIIHNDISHTPYTGISAGWGLDNTKSRSIYHEDFQITHNKITDTMENLRDGGPIYVCGNMFGSDIAYNHIKDSHYHETDGIYLDAGSAEITVYKNVVENAHNWFFIQSGYVAADDFIYDNYSNKAGINKSGDLTNTVYNEPYILKRGEYPKEAFEIMENAGVEEGYKHLLEEAKLPSWRKQTSLYAPSQGFFSAERYEPRLGWIQAEDFIPGENGETYYDVKNATGNNAYRPEGVNLIELTYYEGDYTGWTIGEVSSGEWMTYNVRIPEDGEYTFKVNAAHNYDNVGNFNLYVDDELAIENGVLKHGEKGFRHAVVTSFDGISMTAGDHVIKYQFTDAGHYLDAIGFFSDKHEGNPIDLTKNSDDYDDCTIVYDTSSDSFEDITGHYAENDIIAMKSEGIINGVDNTNFAPEAPLTREQAAWLCLRAADVPFDISIWKDVAEPIGMISQINDNIEDLVDARFGWIQAENFIPGEQGVTYHDKNNKLNNNRYRRENVGLLERVFEVGNYDGYVIHESGEGEWVTYKVRIPEDGEYTFKVNASHSYEEGGNFNLYVDGEMVIENARLQKGELGWKEILESSFGGIKMTAGEHIIKYEFADAGHYVDAIGFFSDKFEPDAEDTNFENVLSQAYIYDGSVKITREEFAHMLMAAYGVLKYDDIQASELDYKDKESIDSKYAEDIAKAYTINLMVGDENGCFNPKANLTRAEAAVAIRRLLEK